MLMDSEDVRPVIPGNMSCSSRNRSLPTDALCDLRPPVVLMLLPSKHHGFMSNNIPPLLLPPPTNPREDRSGLCMSVSYTHLRAHETPEHLVCRLLLEKKKKNTVKR
eukprot:TRINITY_DN39008_c0_g1_i4.p2 TRINITY_DN39008_c0_g1~~TRINITY_DN39008_c0_g1_i4.p2  ORF type:complete len:107 (-),score=13.47 TRINITY_DN39008_c0_g1_i4:85-405(-)